MSYINEIFESKKQIGQCFNVTSKLIERERERERERLKGKDLKRLICFLYTQAKEGSN